MGKFLLVVLFLLGSRLPSMAQGCSVLGTPTCDPSTCSDYTPLPGTTTDFRSVYISGQCTDDPVHCKNIEAQNSTEVNDCSEDMLIQTTAVTGWRGDPNDVDADGKVWRASDGYIVLDNDSADYCVVGTNPSCETFGPVTGYECASNPILSPGCP